MNFEFKALDLSGAALEKCEAMVLLFGGDFKPGKDAVSALLSVALKAGDIDAKAGKALLAYRPAGVLATRLVLAGVGEGSAREVRQALSAAIGQLKGAKLKKIDICFATTPQPAALRAAVTAVAEATYVYTSTKSKPEG